MEIAELVVSCISTVIAILSFIFAFFAKKESKSIKQELNLIIKNNPDIKISSTTKEETTVTNKVKGNSNITAGGNIHVER